MSERFDTTICIGGTLRSDLEQFRDLIQAFEDDPGGTRWVPAFGGEDHLVDGALIEDLTIRSAEARSGDEADLLAFCQAHDLSYSFDQDASGYNYDREYRFWQPGMDAPTSLSLTNDGEPFVRHSELVRHRDEGGTLNGLISRLNWYAAFAVPAFRILVSPTSPDQDAFSLVGSAIQSLANDDREEAMSSLVKARDLLRVDD